MMMIVMSYLFVNLSELALTQFKADKNSINSSFSILTFLPMITKRKIIHHPSFIEFAIIIFESLWIHFPKLKLYSNEITLNLNLMNLDLHFTKKLMKTFVPSLFHQALGWYSAALTTYSPFKCALLPSAMSLTHMIMCKNAIAACNDKNVWVRSVVYIFPLRSVAWWQQKTGFLPTTTQPIIPSDCLNCSQ